MNDQTAKNLRPDGLKAEPQIDFNQARAEAKASDQVGFRVRFLCNIHDPKDPNASMYVVRSFHESPEEAWRHHQEWLQGKVIADPCGTDTYTVEKLKEMGMVGVYAKVEPEEPRGAALDALLGEDSPLRETFTI